MLSITIADYNNETRYRNEGDYRLSSRDYSETRYHNEGDYRLRLGEAY